jgi:hypothetical protein
MKACFLVAITALVATNVNAECANACSGHGTCGARDACTCHKNWMANDCSQRVCPFAHAFVDSPKGDLDMSGGALSPSSALVAKGDAVYPDGTTEQYPDADDNEGHFYMECANKGLCNRKTGDCACFDGYEGTACARTVCPDSCNGHGTCETIQELAEMGTFDTTAAHVASTTAFTYTYSLWDKEKTVGCKCDEGYFGNDCSMKKCKYGVDPLFESEGKRIAAEFRVKTDAPTTTSFKLKMYDVFGEDYITADIRVDATVDEFCQAIDILPNGVFDMDRTPDNKMGTRYTNTEGDATYYDCFVGIGATSFDHKEACCHKNGNGDFTIYLHNNPGPLKAPEFFSSDPSGKVVGGLNTYGIVAHISSVPGEYVDYFGKKMQLASQLLAGSTAPIASVVEKVLTCADTTACAAEVTRLGIMFPAVMKLQNEVYVVAAHAAGVFTLAEKAIDQTQTLSTSTILTAPYIFFASLALTEITETVTAPANPDAPNEWVFSADVGAALRKEQKFIYMGIVYTVYKVSSDGLTVNTIENFIDGGATGIVGAIHRVDPVIADTNFEYTTQCSNRGVCETSTGLCKCFKGYSNDNCDTQNVYAL